MVKIKITRSDGTVIEAEGTAEELVKLNLIPWNFGPFTYTYNQPYNPQIGCAGGGVILNPGGYIYK